MRVLRVLRVLRVCDSSNFPVARLRDRPVRDLWRGGPGRLHFVTKCKRFDPPAKDHAQVTRTRLDDQTPHTQRSSAEPLETPMSLSSVIQTQRVDLMIRGTSSNSDARGYFGNPCSSKTKTKRPTRLWDFDMTTFCAQPGAGDLLATISHILSDIKEWGALIVLKMVSKDLKNLIEPVWSELIGAIDDAHTDFYHARLQLIGRRQTGARMPQPIHGNNSHMTESAVLRWKEHMATMQIVHSREQESKRLFIENAAAVFGYRIASHMCKFLENPSRTGLHHWSPEGCIHSLPFICDGKVNNSFAWHTLTNKCQVHFPLGEPCHHGLSALDRGYSDQGQLFTSVAGADGIQSTVLHCKLACVHSQCVEISTRSDFPLNPPVRNVEKKSKTARVKQLLAMKGVAAPFERGCVLDALGLLRSASMPPFLWIVDHPSIPTGVSIQSMAQLSNAEVQFVDAQMHLQAKASADRVAADRKIHIDAMMAELDQEIKFSKLPYSSVVEVGQTFNGVPTLFSMAVAAVHDSPPPGWSGSIRETDRVLQLLQLLYRMHAAQECVFNRGLSPVSPGALAWFHDLWGVDLPNNVKSCSAWRSAASRPQFDRTWRIPIEEQQESDPRQGDREKYGNEVCRRPPPTSKPT